jgi:uncharacterized coiled-coil protein SlyX
MSGAKEKSKGLNKKRTYSMKSESTLSKIDDLKEELDSIEKRLEELTEHSILTKHRKEALEIKGEMEQLVGRLEKFQFKEIDAIETQTLKSGKTEAKESRKKLNVQVEALSERVKSIRGIIMDILNEREKPLDKLKLFVTSWNVGNAAPDPKEFHNWLPNVQNKGDILEEEEAEEIMVKTEKQKQEEKLKKRNKLVNNTSYDLIVIGLQECDYELSDEMNKIASDTKQYQKEHQLIMKSNKDAEAAAIQQKESHEYKKKETVQNFSKDFTRGVKKTVEKGTKKAITSKAGYHFAGEIRKYLGEDYFLVQLSELMQMRLLVFAKKKHLFRIKSVEFGSEATGIGGVVGNKGGIFISVYFESLRLCFCSAHLAAHEQEKFVKHRNHNCDEIFRAIMKKIGVRHMPVSLESEKALKQIYLHSCNRLTTSDHKPVRSGFELVTNNTVPRLSDLPTGTDTGEEDGFIIRISNLKAIDLDGADADGFADPYIVMFSDELFDEHTDGVNPKKGACSTRVLRHRLDAKWTNSSYVMRVSNKLKSVDELSRRHLALAVWDFDRLTKNDLMGTVVIPLKEAVEAYKNLFENEENQKGKFKAMKKKQSTGRFNTIKGAPVEFNKTIVHFSHQGGTISGKLEILPSFFKVKTREPKGPASFCTPNEGMCGKCNIQ